MTRCARSVSDESSAAMLAVLGALEGLNKELARVRARTSQLGERIHTTDSRLAREEDQVLNIKKKMQDLMVRF